MANLRETSTWEVGIYQLETSDPVMGGENGIDNRAPRQLANRTLWLKNQLSEQSNSLAEKLPLSGGNLTGNLTINNQQVYHAGNLPAQNWQNLQNKPTSLQGFGITDALKKDADDTTTGIISINRADSYIKGEHNNRRTWYVGSGSSRNTDVQLRNDADNTEINLKPTHLATNKPLTVSGSPLATNTPFALHGTGLQSWGTIQINANTDNLNNSESVLLTAGRGATADLSHGLAVSANHIKWLGDKWVIDQNGHMSAKGNVLIEANNAKISGNVGNEQHWKIGINEVSGRTDDNVVMWSYKHNHGMMLEANKVSFSKELYVGSNKVYHAGNLPPFATKLQTARRIALTGAVTGSVIFDGSANVTMNTSLDLAGFSSLKMENGYQKMPTGLIIQWGKLASNSHLGETAQSITFPITFPNACLNVQASMCMERHSPAGDGNVLVVDFNRSTANFSLQVFGTNAIEQLRGFYWFAIGH